MLQVLMKENNINMFKVLLDEAHINNSDKN